MHILSVAFACTVASLVTTTYIQIIRSTFTDRCLISDHFKPCTSTTQPMGSMGGINKTSWSHITVVPIPVIHSVHSFVAGAGVHW